MSLRPDQVCRSPLPRPQLWRCKWCKQDIEAWQQLRNLFCSMEPGDVTRNRRAQYPTDPLLEHTNIWSKVLIKVCTTRRALRFPWSGQAPALKSCLATEMWPGRLASAEGRLRKLWCFFCFNACSFISCFWTQHPECLAAWLHQRFSKW